MIRRSRNGMQGREGRGRQIRTWRMRWMVKTRRKMGNEKVEGKKDLRQKQKRLPDLGLLSYNYWDCPDAKSDIEIVRGQ